MDFPRQGYLSGVPFPSPGDLPDPGVELRSPALQEDSLPSELLVLYCTGTWWPRVDDERVKEGKRLIFPGFRSWLSCSRESARKRVREREKERKKDTGTQALMEQRCFNQHSVGIYIVLQGSYSQQR